MTTLSKRVLALVAAGASALAIASQFLTEKEGADRLTAYQDGGGIWTACQGVTKNVHAGDVFTQAQCDAMDKEALDEADAVVTRLVKVPLTNPERAAVISFCAYNIGPGKCGTSTFLRKLNAGDRTGACNEIKRWIYDGGKDCRERGNNCYGQVIRREQEKELCQLN